MSAEVRRLMLVLRQLRCMKMRMKLKCAINEIMEFKNAEAMELQASNIKPLMTETGIARLVQSKNVKGLQLRRAFSV